MFGVKKCSHHQLLFHVLYYLPFQTLTSHYDCSVFPEQHELFCYPSNSNHNLMLA